MKFGIYLLLAKLAVLAIVQADDVVQSDGVVQSDDVVQRIKDGREAVDGDFSFIGKIVNKGKQVCSCMLVGSEWVATLSTCINKKSLSKYKVYFSSTKSKGKKPDVKRTIKKMKIADQKDSDIVLLQLNKEIKQSKDKVQPFDRFSSKALDDSMKNCKAVGFSENGKKLNKVAISIKKTSKCSGSTSEKHLCFDTNEGSVCKVDNGSPVLCQYKSKWYLMGTSLVSKGCKSTGIKGFRLSFFRKSITDIVNEDDEIKDCGAVPDVTHGNYELVEGSTTVGSTYKVTCFYGYKANKKVLKCQASGKWETTKCKEKDNFDIYRIPQDFTPVLYNVELRPDIYVDEADFSTTGSVKILLRCVKSTNIITLNINGLSIDAGNIYVKPENEAENLYRTYEIDETRQILYILTNRQVEAGQNYILKISEFSGSLESSPEGLYYGSYTQGYDKVYYVTSQLEPVWGRTIFPCFDEPAMKSQFDITLLRKRNMTSISNMPLSKSTDRGDGWIADKFDRTPIMSTYILAFVVCDFDHLEQITANGIEFRTWSRPDVVNQTSYSLDIGGRMMTYFEDSFTIPYPLPKEDMVAVNNFGAGAMENWGLVVYREQYMLYEPGTTTNIEKQYVATIVAHELAHMWFGNLVSPAWWSDLWLNEGFASYFEYVGADYVHPEWKMFEQFIKSAQQYVLLQDSIPTSHPVHMPILEPENLIDIFDVIMYSKGACMVRMLKFLVGDATFNSGIIKYLNQQKYDVATSDDLWAALRNQSIEDNNDITDIKGIMDTWILQMNYPVVYVNFSTTGQISLNQSRYLTNKNVTDPGKYTSPYGYKWNIPFAYATSIDKQFDVTNENITMMDTDVDKVTIIDSNIPEPTGHNWVLGNPMQYGFYRVNYDDRNWFALAEQLNSNHHVIPTTSRAQLLDDSWRLYDSGDLDLLPAMRLTEYLNNEKEWLPWASVASHLIKIGPKIESYPTFELYKKFMQNKTTDLYEELVLNGDGVTHLNSYLQEIIRDDTRACYYGVTGCVDNAKQLFSEWMENENKTIDSGIKADVYCTSIAEGGTDYWEFVVDQLGALDGGYQAERFYLMYALSCSKNTSNIQRLIQMAADPLGLLVEYLSLVLDFVSRNPLGRPLAWNYVTTNWDYLLNERTTGLKYGIGDSLYTIIYRFTTEEELTELETFAEEIKEDVDNDFYLSIVIEDGIRAIQEKLDWLHRNLPLIQRWLEDQGY